MPVCSLPAPKVLSPRLRAVTLSPLQSAKPINAKKQGLSTVFRIFVIDSKALESMNHHSTEYADLIELLPGVMPKIIKKVAQKSKVPIIAGGLIADKEDVIAALDAGATAISSTNQKVWKL